MTARGIVAAELTWAQVHAMRVERHRLKTRAPKKDLAKVVAEIGGAQAQVMSAAELQIVARVDCSVEDVRKALWKEKTLVKTWLMRGTLHLIPADDLPVYAAAMRTRWVKPSDAWLKFLGVSEPELRSLVGTIAGALNGQPMTREEVIAMAGKGQPENVWKWLKSGWGGVLKPVARQGLLCFGPSRAQNVTFVRPQEWLGHWRDIEPDSALLEVARRYLRTYGPATKTDFTRWFGNWPGAGNAAWSGLAGELARVTVDGVRADMLAADLPKLARVKVEQSVALLPTFDPYLMGHSNRDHLFDPKHRAKVSRTAGWISAVVLVQGQVAGTWTHRVTATTMRITIEPFKALPAAVKAEIQVRAESLAEAIGLAKAEVKISQPAISA